MFKSLLRLIAPAPKTPILVTFTDGKPGHSRDADGAGIAYGDILINLSLPMFFSDSTNIYVVVSNLGRKAIGFGAEGFGLVLTYGDRKTTMTAHAIIEQQRGSRRVPIDEEQKVKTLMVDGGEGGSRGVHFVVEFPAAAEADRSELTIQANRILDAPIMFYLPLPPKPSSPEIKPPDSQHDSPNVGSWEELMQLPKGTKIRFLDKDERPK
ncbi:MAG TPA: hypothetical protein VJQ59_08505 [Candidatus Sulfotelmatobacter sp.]|nr:hypothetical protein [Candidatus Sulfotelmatobacter sp.]